MPFVVRDFPSISGALVAQLVSMVAEVTDYTEGGVARSLLEAVGVEIQRFEVGAAQGIREGILTGTYRNFEFAPLPATHASGMLRVTRVSALTEVTVAEGVLVQVPGSAPRTYITTAAVTLAINETVADVPIRCQSVGVAGNTGANTVVNLISALGFPAVVTNPLPILTGLDAETEAARFQRFQLYILGLSRGTRWAIEAAARSVVLTDNDGNAIERAAAVAVHEPFLDDPPGLLGVVEVYVDNGSGTTSAALLDAVQKALNGYVSDTGARVRGYVAAGIDLDVYGVTALAVPVTMNITVAVGYTSADVAAEVKAAIESYLQGLAVFQGVIVAELVTAAMNVEGVTDAVVLDPEDNVSVSFGSRAIPGTVAVTVVS